MNTSKTGKIVLAAMLTAISIIIPMFMPKLPIPIPYYTATLASHVPIALAVFFAPSIMPAVVIGGAIGFFFAFNYIVSLRAASHIFYAAVMVLLFKKFSKDKLLNIVWIGAVTGVIHAVCEVLVIILVTGQNNMVINTWTIVGTFIHHLVDLFIAFIIYKAVSKTIHFNG